MSNRALPTIANITEHWTRTGLLALAASLTSHTAWVMRRELSTVAGRDHNLTGSSERRCRCLGELDHVGVIVDDLEEADRLLRAMGMRHARDLELPSLESIFLYLR